MSAEGTNFISFIPRDTLSVLVNDNPGYSSIVIDLDFGMCKALQPQLESAMFFIIQWSARETPTSVETAMR